MTASIMRIDFSQIGEDFRLRPGAIRPARIAWFGKLLLSLDFFRPGFVAAGDVLHLLAEAARVVEPSRGGLEVPLVFRHDFGQRGEVMRDLLPYQLDGVGRALRPFRGLPGQAPNAK